MNLDLPISIPSSGQCGEEKSDFLLTNTTNNIFHPSLHIYKIPHAQGEEEYSGRVNINILDRNAFSRLHMLGAKIFYHYPSPPNAWNGQSGKVKDVDPLRCLYIYSFNMTSHNTSLRDSRGGSCQDTDAAKRTQVRDELKLEENMGGVRTVLIKFYAGRINQ